MFDNQFWIIYFVLIILVSVVLVIWAGYLGKQRKIGTNTSVILAIVLTFPISLIYILLSPKLPVSDTHRYRTKATGVGRKILVALMVIALIIPIALMFTTDNVLIVLGGTQLMAGVIRLLGYFVYGE